MNYNFIRNNINSFAILLFLVSFSLLNFVQPGFLYNNNGTLREFGLGQRRKTVLPIWLLSLLLGILSYLAVLYFITIPKFM
jgi:hypothetical protein